MKIAIHLRKNPINPLVGPVIRGDSCTTVIHCFIPRNPGGVDLGDLSWSIHVKNALGQTNVYVPDNVFLKDDGITFQWAPSGTATAQSGLTLFSVEGVGGTEEAPKVWQSAVYQLIVKDNLEAEIDSEAGQALTDLQSLIQFVNTELENVIAARAAAEAAAAKIPTDVFQAENAGRLIYIGPDGRLQPLAIGNGLTISNGALTVTGSASSPAAICGDALCGAAICGKE